jgi:hypothetical protein
MFRKFGAALSALALGTLALAPLSTAEARDHGYYGGRGYYGGGYRHHDHDGDAVAAGVVGLALGAVLGAALSAPRDPPPQRYYGPPQGYYAPPPGRPYNDGYYEDRRYDDGPQTCYSRERQWDRYAQRYVTVDVPREC